MISELVSMWFRWLQEWGYAGVFILMAMESTIIPIPSELVMPPAAYWAAQGHMSFWGVVSAGVLGSCFGSAVSYWLARILGQRIIDKFGKYVWITPEGTRSAGVWFKKYGLFGVFLARIFPVIRHLISIPAGIYRMNFVYFTLVTGLGAGVWCFALSFWGKEVIGKYPELINSPEEMMRVVRQEMSGFVLGILIVGSLYLLMTMIKLKASSSESK